MMKKFFKQSIGILTGILLLGSVFAAVQQWNNSKLEISQKRMLFTDNGKPLGAPIMDINTGGNIIAYGQLVDGAMNPYITGMNLSGYITGYTETDPIYMVNSGLYYLASNPSGYIDSGALNRQYAGGLLTPVHTGTIKFHVGYGGSANGTDSISMGYNTTSQGNNSVAIGNQTQAIGYGSVAMGMGTTASGNYSFAVGYDTITNGVYSNAFGIGTITNANSCTSIGKYNIGLTNSIFEVGIGLSGGARYNALTITNTGVIKLDQLTGYACLATDVNGAIYDNSSSFVGWVDIDTGFNNTGSDTIIPSEKAVWGLMDGLTDTYIPYRSGDRFYDSNMFRFDANTTYINRFLVFTGVSQGLYITKGDIGVEQYGDDTNAIAGSSFGGGAGIAGTAYSSGTNPGGYGLVGYLGDSNPLSVQLRLINPTGSYTGNALEINNTAGPNTGNVARIEKQGNIHTVGAYHLTGGTTPWRIIVSGDNLSFQAYTGGNRLERGFFTP